MRRVLAAFPPRLQNDVIESFDDVLNRNFSVLPRTAVFGDVHIALNTFVVGQRSYIIRSMDCKSDFDVYLR